MGIMDTIISEFNKDKKQDEEKWERLNTEPYQIVQTKNGLFHNPIKVTRKEKEE